jgi:5-methyltetrahydrofolate--homocysteine methyltransferase
MMTLRDVLAGTGVLLLDGATGTQLSAMGLSPGGLQNLLHPESVRAVHESYLRAGSRGIITNTLTDNRIFIESHGVGTDVGAVNRAAAAIAREAVANAAAKAGPASAGAENASVDAGHRSGGAVPWFVLGDLSSTGHLLEPYGELSEERAVQAYAEQARILAEAGVDGLLVETMMDLREALAALRGCRQAGALPVLVTMSFQTLRDGGRTAMGNRADECARALTGEGADAIGVNCGDLDPFETAEILARFRDASPLPLVAQPNAGKPRLEAGTVRFDMEPERFAEGIAACVKRGARVVGGCCGTTPAHIEALARSLGLR